MCLILDLFTNLCDGPSARVVTRSSGHVSSYESNYEPHRIMITTSAVSCENEHASKEVKERLELNR
jgi:hypothetical protein